MKILTIVGARPQFIKAAAVSRAWRLYRPDVNEILVHTGQHYDANMSDVFFQELELPAPQYHLGIGGGTHGQNTGRMIEAVESVILSEKPDGVLVFGDTDSTLAGALAAAKLHVPVGHVEAGLRSFNRQMPEEINRILTDHISHWLFTPTITATKHLKNEGIDAKNIIQTGDVMYDATLFYRERAKWPDAVSASKPFILFTLHRAENTDNTQRFVKIFDEINHLAADFEVIFPVHPRTRQKLMADYPGSMGIKLIDPVGYLEMMALLHQCSMVITDSGGLQKEAYFFEKPCLILRNETEWVELMETGNHRLELQYPNAIKEQVYELLQQNIEINKGIYGEGNASELVVRNWM